MQWFSKDSYSAMPGPLSFALSVVLSAISAYGTLEGIASRPADDAVIAVNVANKADGPEDGAEERVASDALKLAPDEVAAEVIGVETIDVVIPAKLHRQGLEVPAKLVRPRWSKSVGEQPAMLVLHGSGGLTKMPKSKADKACSAEMESQFVEWADRLAKQGYTVLLPSSYSARGFCDKHDDAKRIPKDFDDKPEQIIGRMYDVDAASRYLCELPGVDCDRMGLLGFSQGATMVMLTLHWQLDHAIKTFRDEHGEDVDFEIEDLEPGRPTFQVGVAYYPGCGFDGVVPLSTSKKASILDKYSATAPLLVLHGSDDDLVEHCSEEYGDGEREIQARQIAKHFGIENTYDLTVFEDAGHSFDNPGGSKGGGGTKKGNAKARKTALALTLARLKAILQ